MNDLEIYKNAPEGASPEEIVDYLNKACGGDLVLRSKVEALFEAEAKAKSNFLNGPPDLLNETTILDDETELSQSKEETGIIIGRF